MKASEAIYWDRLHLSPVALDVGPFELRWYALSYIAMFVLGWWYLRKLVAQPGAPLATRHIDDIVAYAAVGVIAGGRLGYCLFYQPGIWATPLKVLEVWNGGMSLHGGLIGVLLAIWLFTRRHRLDLLRTCDYIACATPFGLILVRVANFVNGELWGRPTSLPWGVVFPGTGDGIPRHPSQLYEALFEGVLTMAVLVWMFWRSDTRYRPGLLFGTGLLIYGVARFGIEFLRQPDEGLENLSWGLTMGQTLSVPLIAGGAILVARALRRDPVIAGSVAAPPAGS